jgi:hypothetical protein
VPDVSEQLQVCGFAAVLGSPLSFKIALVFEALGPPLSFKVALVFEALGPLSFKVALVLEASPVSSVSAAVDQPRDGTTAEHGDGTPDHHIGQAHSSLQLLRGATLGTHCSALLTRLLPSTRTPGLRSGPAPTAEVRTLNHGLWPRADSARHPVVAATFSPPEAITSNTCCRADYWPLMEKCW